MGLAGATPLHSQSVARPLSDAQATRWRGVALLYVNGKNVCSAELISKTEATTAAHCVYSRKTAVYTPAAIMELVFEQRNGRRAAVRGVRSVAVLPGFTAPGPRTALSTMPWDIALLELDAAVLPETVQPFQLADWPDPAATYVDIVGYERPVPEYPKMRQGCRVIESSMGVAAAACAVVGGISGAPVALSFTASERPLLVAEVSSRGKTQGGLDLALVVPIVPHLAALRALIGHQPWSEGPTGSVP
jgi:V8-like Glu-specific endopeptidase